MQHIDAEKESPTPKPLYPQGYPLCDPLNHDSKVVTLTSVPIAIILSRAIMTTEPQEPYMSREEPNN